MHEGESWHPLAYQEAEAPGVYEDHYLGGAEAGDGGEDSGQQAPHLRVLEVHLPDLGEEGKVVRDRLIGREREHHDFDWYDPLFATPGLEIEGFLVVYRKEHRAKHDFIERV